MVAGMTRPSATGRSGKGSRRSKKDEQIRKLRNDQQQMSLFDQPTGKDKPRGEGSHGAAPAASSNRSTRSYGADDRGEPRKQVPEPIQMRLAWLDPQTDTEHKFVAFHKAHPEVEQLLEKFAKEELLANQEENAKRVASGLKQEPTRIGMKDLWEKLRKHIKKQTCDLDFKLNNNYTALYGRLLIHNYPYLEPFIKLRARQGETPKE